MAPEVAVPGKTTAILVTLHGRAGDTNLDPLNVTVRLETQDADNDVKLLTSASQMITGMFTYLYNFISNHCISLPSVISSRQEKKCTDIVESDFK